MNIKSENKQIKVLCPKCENIFYLNNGLSDILNKNELAVIWCSCPICSFDFDIKKHIMNKFPNKVKLGVKYD